MQVNDQLNFTERSTVDGTPWETDHRVILKSILEKFGIMVVILLKWLRVNSNGYGI
jgi:hypothetical protein